MTTGLVCTSTNNDEIDALFRGANRTLARNLIAIVGDLRDWWPMTVRQVYYQCVAKLLIPNAQAQYHRISRLITDLRRADLLPWHAIEDRSRRTTDKRGLPNLAEYAKLEMETFFNWRYYHRCYVQKQRVYVEIATEKDALASIIENAAWLYCTRLNVLRGQVSATMVNAIAERFDKAIMHGFEPVLLHLGDLDPSGVAIPKALKRNLYDHHSIAVRVERVALNPEQVERYNLPVSVDAAKEQDPNFGAWYAEYGEQAPVELDALHPRDLTKIVEAALERTYDMGGFDEQVEKEKEERELIRKIRFDVEDLLYTEYPEVFGLAME